MKRSDNFYFETLLITSVLLMLKNFHCIFQRTIWITCLQTSSACDTVLFVP